MSDGPAISHARGVEVLREVLVLLAGSFTRAAPAGSIRRGKPTVSDVELVIAPAWDGTRNLLNERLDDLLGSKLERRVKNTKLVAWGKPNELTRWKVAVFEHINVDFFIVQHDRQWGPTMVLRTGPYEANRILVTQWGVRNDLGDLSVLPPGLKWRDGALWRGELRLDTPEEEHVFAACALPWLPPSLRTVRRYQQWSDPDWDGAYRVSYIRNCWREKTGSGIPRDAIDVDGVPLWLDEQFSGAVPTAGKPNEPLAPAIQIAMFEQDQGKD